ncbi:FtsX-like permease family protein [uncultured Pseudodesulfovibrio sp.]|uniref:ABC transporter permease n=1 Tax=uncultured Pseudodesulfovibrio sp. TaxID=2035858 RepID=UPI0029C8473E|nr:FtsX-like permease family protein [uncultured Pseudodesulfovibrio sp.]
MPDSDQQPHSSAHAMPSSVTLYLLVRMAFRNIARNKRRSLLTVSTMIMASSMLMVAMGVSAGKMSDMLTSATDQYHGHIVISGKGYKDDGNFYTHFGQSEVDVEGLERLPEVRGISPRLRCFGLLSHDKNTSSVEVLGIRPDKEATVTSLQTHLVAGHGFDESGNGALIGKGLAESLGAVPGDSLVFVTQAADGSIGNDLLEIKGIFATGNTRNDNALVLADLKWLQNVLVLPGEVHELAVSVKHPLEVSRSRDMIAKGLPDGLEARDWRSFLPEIRDAIVISHVTNGIIMVIMYLTAALCVFNTFYMSVMERSREFGIIMALGARPWNIRVMVLLESFFMGCVAVTFGIVLGFLFNWYLSGVGIDLSASVAPITYGGGTIMPRIHAVIHPLGQVLAALCLLIVCPVAGFVPANKAAKLTPVEVIRGE